VYPNNLLIKGNTLNQTVCAKYASMTIQISVNEILAIFEERCRIEKSKMQKAVVTKQVREKVR
jgi:hypothetical protein